MKIILMEPLGISEDTLKRLSDKLTEQGHTFKAYDTVTTDTDELIERAEDAEVLIIANHPLPGEVIRADKKLKLVSVAFVGIDHVDVEACKKAGVLISNTGGYCDDAVAELAIGLTLDCLRNITECNAVVQDGLGKGNLAGYELAGKTVGIVGTGAIGVRAAAIFKVFGCKLIGYNRSEKIAAKALGLEYMSLIDVMAKADIISVHTPLTPETKGLIGEKEIAAMKQGAIIVNTARGPVIETEALAKALKERRIKAGIDVFEKDPPLPESHPLIGVPNLLCTPHVGFDTRESIDRRAEMVFENVTSWIGGNQIRKVL
ncbi:NAD(P)-dependent oxidoreductase [Mogibacterium pumilum]|uniref:Hydroxyacid dehydrogenase n=1 Tax=Mogibacterium pumilum TaxID=86332 RepID=A0A223ATA4_9FIRM|nr:NAD(P)-dependent oxidoreductase [Mogibacterium pumilum]ASS38191.1 hydroxyacid dehydrogenase [Mogibacterium pumilum]